MNAKPLYKYLWELFHFATILQAAGISRSVWSAWSLLPLWCAVGGPKAPASWTHSIRFAPFGCGRAALRYIADFQSAAPRCFARFNPGRRSQAGSPAIQQIGNLRYARNERARGRVGRFDTAALGLAPS